MSDLPAPQPLQRPESPDNAGKPLRHKAIALHDDDNVVTLLSDGHSGEEVTASQGLGEIRIVLLEDVPFGHKAALTDIPAGQAILKYGLPIGQASQAISKGQWVHVHNCSTHRLGRFQKEHGIRA
jgi:altronate dehydratase